MAVDAEAEHEARLALLMADEVKPIDNVIVSERPLRRGSYWWGFAACLFSAAIFVAVFPVKSAIEELIRQRAADRQELACRYISGVEVDRTLAEFLATVGQSIANAKTATEAETVQTRIAIGKASDALKQAGLDRAAALLKCAPDASEPPLDPAT